MKNYFYLLPCLITLCVACATNQSASPSSESTAPISAAVYVGCGYLLAENHGATNFTILLAADEARQVPNKDRLWVLDGVLVETVTTPATEIGAPEARGDDLLKRHLEWETKYIASKKGWPQLQPTIGNIDLKAMVPTMTWGYEVPGDLEVLGQKIKRVLYIAAAVDDFVFTLAAPMRPDDDIRVVGPTLQRSIQTLRKVPHATDVVALSREIQATPRPWKGCLER